MWITSDQAAEIYARFCKARYGSEATKKIRTRAAELRKLGDAEGERIWNVVAQKAEGDFAPRMHTTA